ncbi:NADH:ubiquinone oxidoreductase [Sinorhizobium sp. CCBAU 05631]|uniref:NADH:ubiquinone oxidoreductase n=2 Tax=Sinorhizobium sp. CCBAU 05631 TaxID=794846 RepID=UPI000BBF426E|nr:NADH:ubiquinone oxidoreductase [Sinorhizobium sp. CCBAU 05631]ASY55973.1 NADH-ubiquinone oxidoreductase chain E [Sinorhizobium sp. CCBAU 05631]
MAGTRNEGQGMKAAVIPFVPPLGAGSADPFGMAEWMKTMPAVPLMANPVAAVAAATALGFGLSSHFAGIMFGAMQGAASALQKSAGVAEPAEIAEPAPTVEKPAPVTQRASPAPAASEDRPAPVARESKPAPAAREARPAPAAVAKPKARAARKPVAAKPKGGVADDLKQISGIGPKLEQVLNGHGLRRFADIAALSEADVARLDAEFALDGRILRDDWIGQAKTLIGKR